MLNFGFWSSVKGMVKVPNLSGLTKTEAIQSINDNHLSPEDNGAVTTDNQSLDQKIASQSPSAQELVNYESSVLYTYYNYVAPPYSFTPYSFTPTAYSFTPTPAYSFTPTPVYSFTPTTVYYATGCCGTEAAYGMGSTQNAAESALLTNCPSATNIEFSTTDFNYAKDCSGGVLQPPSGYFYTIGSTSISCTNICVSAGGSGNTGTSNCAGCVGGCGANEKCCLCEDAPAPYSFTPYSFTPQAYSFTPVPAYSFTPVPAYSFTPVPAYSFTPYSFTPFAFTPTTYYTLGSTGMSCGNICGGTGSSASCSSCGSCPSGQKCCYCTG